MTPVPQPFTQAENDWNLASLYQDLASAKQQLSGKPKQLTPLEITCLKGLLCGYSPSEIAAAINREVRGLRVDLSRGLYRYIEVLTKRPSNTLKDWREVTDWLAKANYKTSFSHLSFQNNDSLIKIVDISLEASVNSCVIDLKVRNIGNQVAFLKNAKFLFYNVWMLKSWVLPRLEINYEGVYPPAPAIATQRSRTVPPSCDYQVYLPATLNFDIALPLNLNTQAEIVYIENFKISQCVSSNDVDRFTFTLFLPKTEQELSINDQSTYFIRTSYIYNFKLEIIYDEDNKSIQSSDLIILLEQKYPENIETREFIAESDSKVPTEMKKWSQDNLELLTAIAKIKGVMSSSLNYLIKIAVR
ncbi:hypothetical protein IQ276_017275 [Desmonostoc muscorum LEGE 12446]|uniref:Uncharacterized protein n=1 Tax=Desmonostoc muscorum LEGE 12446 TaxID=1828758 RepID=A0A8J6ZHW0_DESMC|nr:hypothetical protein [Desmonostoc muscorum]MCF2148146.1 hypothetical protein [Desmonostoc muscorum LEGE 12446]